jgi:hypothetical protein
MRFFSSSSTQDATSDANSMEVFGGAQRITDAGIPVCLGMIGLKPFRAIDGT